MTPDQAAEAAMLAALTSDALDPMFWPPSRLGVESAWYGHVPFAHWAVCAHRPASIVELGAHNGVSYAAFCEAVVAGRLETRALAVDTWQGDEHAGFYGSEIYDSLRLFHDQRYGAFSTLLRSTFDDALPYVPDGSIDLLHIDGRHRYDDVAHDFATWRQKLSPRAVVLFHDTNVRERDFGVWRLWTELRVLHPGFEFLHGHGLGVLGVGEDLDGPLAALCGLRRGGAINTIRERFALLGERWIAARDLLNLQREASVLRTDVARLDRGLIETRAFAEKSQSEFASLIKGYNELATLHRANRASLSQARYDVAARDLRITEQQAALAAHETRLRRMQARLDEQSARLAEQAAALAVMQARGEAAAAARTRYEAIERALAEATERLAHVQQERDLLLASTSWRITAPLRNILARARGQRPIELAPWPPLPSLPAPLPEPPPMLAPPATETAPPPAPAIESAPDIAETSPATPRACILFITGESHTPGHIYRVERYVDAARRLGLEARWMEAAPVCPDDLFDVRLVVLWRVPFSAHIKGIITMAREQGGIVAFDVDDLMFRPELATVDVIDGIRSQRFDARETQAFFRLIRKTLKACDVTTCPTEELAREARGVGSPAYVLPNGFDDASLAASRRALRQKSHFDDGLMRIGYAGGSRTHQRDFAVAAPAIARVLRERPMARLALFRDPASGEGLVLIDEFPEFVDLAHQIEWRDMVQLADLPAELARFTVNIAPLQPDNPFCEAKSELKFFEAALVGVPTVASPSGPFSRAIVHGVTGMLAESEDAWHASLSLLLDDPARRARMAMDAYHVCLGRFGPEARATAFGLMLAQIEGGAAGAAAFERERYRAALPPPAAPAVPDSEVLFARDRLGEAMVTVIVPVYNYADYVLETLISVAAQTLAVIDLVVIDDCSTDDSGLMMLPWLEANEARFNRITVLRHRANAGLAFARNSGFAMSETPFVLPLDADNRLRPTACEVLLAHLAESGAAFAYPAIQRFGDRDDVFGTEAYSVLRLQRGNYIDAMALVRKSAWAGVGGYEHIQYGWEDFDFWCRLAERGAFGRAVPEVLADYRVHRNSMLHTVTDKRDHRRELESALTRRHAWLALGCEAPNLPSAVDRNG